MESPERKPVLPHMPTSTASKKTRAHPAQIKRESTPLRAVKSERFFLDIPRPKRARSPIQHYDEDINIKPEEIEEDPSSRRKPLLISRPGSARRKLNRRAVDVKPVAKREIEVEEEEEEEEMEKSDSEESDLTDLDEVEAALRREVLEEEGEDSDGYVDGEMEDVSKSGSNKGKKGKGKGRERRVLVLPRPFAPSGL